MCLQHWLRCGAKNPCSCLHAFLPPCVSSLYNQDPSCIPWPRIPNGYFFPSIIQRTEPWEAIRVWWAGAGIKHMGSLLRRGCFSSYRLPRTDPCPQSPCPPSLSTVRWGFSEKEAASPSRTTLHPLLLSESELEMGRCLCRNVPVPPLFCAVTFPDQMHPETGVNLRPGLSLSQHACDGVFPAPLI